jgi:Predicted Fe-S oxidoreductases
MDIDTLALAMDALKKERRLIDIHLSGGEATLRPDLLRVAIEMAAEKNIRLSYLETNGFFAETVGKAVRVLEPLRDAGLKSILVSVSPYHMEGLPLARTMNCLRAGTEIFGHDGVFPWLLHFLPMMSRLDKNTVHPLDEFLAENDMAWGDPELLRLFPLSPGGRVPERLGDFFPRRQADEFACGNCFDILTDVSHFHIDSHGSLFTGHCPGIRSGSIHAGMHEAKSTDGNPVFVALAFGGPFRLMQLAMEHNAYTPDENGYVSPCDLCFKVRRALVRHDASEWPELSPVSYYRE